MKFGQLIEHTMRNIFLEESYAKYGEETIPRSFPKISKLSISLDQQSNIFQSLFFLYAKFRAIKIYLTKLQATCFYFIQSILKKQKEVWNYPPCPIFCMIFEEKYFSCYILLNHHISLSCFLYFIRYCTICLL